jgi:LPS export ABC transporter protein LptC
MMDDIEIQFMNPSKEKVRLSKDGLKEAKKVQTKSALLSAPKGEVATDTHDLSAWGGVHVRSQDGTELFTERLSFSSERQKIYSDSPVRIVRGDSIVIGEGLESSPDLSTVKIFRHKASIVPKQIPMSAVQ